MRHYQIVIVLAAALAAQTPARGGTVGRVDMSTLRTPIYTAEDGAFVRHNGDRFNNRPLYCNQLTAIVVAGDRPLMRFGSGSVLDGTFMAALVRGNKAKWLHDWSDITSKYRPDHMQWIVKDGGFGATVLDARRGAAGRRPGDGRPPSDRKRRGRRSADLGLRRRSAAEGEPACGLGRDDCRAAEDPCADVFARRLPQQPGDDRGRPGYRAAWREAEKRRRRTLQRRRPKSLSPTPASGRIR